MLLVTLYLPPSRTMAAVRLGKLARYLLAQGHDVRVVTPLDPPLPQDLAVDFPADRVVRTSWQPPLSGGQLTPRAPAPAAAGAARSEERRVGTGCVSTCRFRLEAYL